MGSVGLDLKLSPRSAGSGSVKTALHVSEGNLSWKKILYM